MKSIFRYSINPTAIETVIEAPAGAQVLNFGLDLMRGGAPAVWMTVDTEAPAEKRAFVRLETGKESAYDFADLKFLGQAIALAESTSNPGAYSPRTVHFFEATGQTREGIIENANVMAELSA